ncbi:hypothetical protein Y032_0374g210 [Ancylostoma ceylanicum]|uniref:Uncharacterized protein n=1 Tax=Ancylostoma ceylanicum TaxID=53326 RepID=A0A016RUI1_9BILA|nr:hypothetical protein Y032_0374g210 [Ancylostoma ceylanicum]
MNSARSTCIPPAAARAATIRYITINGRSQEWHSILLALRLQKRQDSGRISSRPVRAYEQDVIDRRTSAAV